MSVTLTCYGGIGEIGGNKILLEDGDARLLLDFGIPFGRQQRFYNELLRPRAARGLLDPLALGLLPPVQGLYRQDLALPGLWERFQNQGPCRDLRRLDGRPAIDAVLISHAHLDHNGDLSFLDEAIPVHTTRVTAFISRAMQVTGVSTFEREMVWINPRCPAETGELVSDRQAACRARPHLFFDGELAAEARAWWEEPPSAKGLASADVAPATGTVGGLRVRWWPVDHSIPGAAALAVETSAGWIAYTGDVRFHGKHGDRTRRFVQELAGLEPAVLLCEGTHAESARASGAHTSSAHVFTEADIVHNALPLIRQAAGRLVVADFGPRNVERLYSFLELARHTHRALLVQPKDAYLLRAIAAADPMAFPDPRTLPDLKLYADPKAAPRPWERALRKEWAAATVQPKDVCVAPGDYILAWSLWDLNDLLDLEGIEGGIYLYSNSRAYDDEQAADLERLRQWVNHMGLTLFGDPDDPQAVPLHASGHASGPDLSGLVRSVNPKVLVPIHTEYPDWWQAQLAGTEVHLSFPQAGSPMHVP